MPDLSFLLMIGAVGAFMYFLMIRPQQKRMKQHQETIGALTPGTRVLLTSGVFATVRHLGERQAIVELAPGTEITIVKGNIARPVTADEEEFEFADDLDLDVEILDDDVQPAPVDEADVTFDPRGDGDILAEELQRKFDN